jgi:hypothetical protein
LIYLHGSYYFSTFIHIICCLQVTLKGINLRSSCLYRIKTESHLFNHFKIKRHKRCIHLIWFKKKHVIIYKKVHVYLFNNNNNNMKESRLIIIYMTIITRNSTNMPVSLIRWGPSENIERLLIYFWLFKRLWKARKALGD